MLDLLARSQDLDDEKAIELLQQSKLLHEQNEAAKADRKAVSYIHSQYLFRELEWLPRSRTSPGHAFDY